MKNQANDRKQKLAAIYARTSGYGQKDSFSIQEQINTCMTHCKEQGWQVKYIFVDEAKTGENTHRPKFQLMLDRARANEFDVIMAWKIDRLCRSLADLVNTERELRRLNIGISSVTEKIDTVTALGRFNFRNLASYAELEREIIGERTKMGLYGLIKRHKWPTGTPPLGFDRRKNGDLRPNNNEVNVINKVLHLYIRTKSFPQTAFTLIQQGVKTRKIKHWTARTVHDIVTNTLYVGEFKIAGFCEKVKEFQVVDVKLFRKANRIRTRYKTGKAKRPPMPTNRKMAQVEKIFNRYSELLEPKRQTIIV